jgi:hypothetical protein
MKTSIRDVIKIRKNANVQLFNLADIFVTELKLKIKNKKRNNENFMTYIVPPYRLGRIVYDREEMQKLIFDKIKDRYDANSRDNFRINIVWDKKQKKDPVPSILFQIDSLIQKNAKANRSFCIYTLHASIEYYKDYEIIMDKINKQIKQNGFKTSIEGNKILIYWTKDKPKEQEEVNKPINKPIKKPELAMKVNKPKIALNTHSFIRPIDTRSHEKKDIVKLFKQEMKRYSGKNSTVSSSPGHTLNRRTVLDQNDIENEIDELNCLV